ncbi:hypothetical protein R3P38DRAFT_2974089 [Favolaschia claudopus]|uniref:Uncharacterized protein n=1 Tax=Favolaschia claudopus TaxID=2862362 RepID=A0AAW0B2Z8_9AGAR
MTKAPTAKISESSPKKSKSSRPGLGTRQKEWRDALSQTPRWVWQANFRHPRFTKTITKTAAISTYSVNAREIETLPYELRPSSQPKPMHLYNENQVIDLAMKKCKTLEKKFETKDVVYHSHSGSSETGIVAVMSLKNPYTPTPQPWDLDPPLIIKEYTCPSEAEKPDPSPIVWSANRLMGPVLVRDACRLYCLEPNEIQDLSEHSRWIDLETAAKRALTLHGGFHAHEKFVLRHREAEEKLLEQEWWAPRTTPRSDYIRSPFRISKEVEYDDSEEVYDERCVEAHRHGRTVAVFYPIKYVTNHFGAAPEWKPGWGDF